MARSAPQCRGSRHPPSDRGPRTAPPPVQPADALRRYVGTNDIINNEVYLKEWAIVAADWIREGKHPYIFIHTPDQVSQPVVSAHFHALLSEFVDLEPLPIWPGKREQQLKLF